MDFNISRIYKALTMGIKVKDIIYGYRKRSKFRRGSKANISMSEFLIKYGIGKRYVKSNRIHKREGSK